MVMSTDEPRPLLDVLASCEHRQGDEQAYTCPSHGEYRGRPWTLTGAWHDPECPRCADERVAAEDEQRRQAEEQARLQVLLRAGIPMRFVDATLEGYEAQTPEQRRALKVVRRYVERFADRRKVGGSLSLLGCTGTGKTHLACALAIAVRDQGWRVRYTDVLSLLHEIRATYTTRRETEEQVVHRYVTPDLLVLDEIGVQRGTDDERATLHHVLDQRYLAMRPTVVVGNVDLAGLTAYLGERAVSRLHEAGGLVVPFDWDDHRIRR